MSDKKESIIDFHNIEGPVYTGRDRGERLRTQLKIDELDDESEIVKVIIPPETYTISSSFFLGLFGPTIVKLGSKELFLARYKFETSDFLVDVINKHIARALQERNLFS
jgi:hypothetical protein